MSVTGKTRALNCKWCDRTFNKGEHLRRHERAHTGAKPYVCAECKRTFNRQDSLARHEKLHTRTTIASEYPSPSTTDVPLSTPSSHAVTDPELPHTGGQYHVTPETCPEPATHPSLPNFPLPGEQDFSLIWPDTEDLFHSIVSLDNQWQIPIGTLPFPSDCQQTVNSGNTILAPFTDRALSIDTIPSGGSHHAVHNVSKMVSSLSSVVTTAAEANSINSIFLDECLHMFFVKFIPTFPVLHRATFVFRDCLHPLLLNAIAIGSLYLGPKDATAKGETLWRLAHTAIATSWQSLITHQGTYDSCEGVQLVITALLAQLYGALSKNRAIRTASQALRSLGLFWARQTGMYESSPFERSDLPTLESSENVKQHQWHRWVAREIQQRALLAHYMLDGLIADMTGEPTTVRHTANSLVTPSTDAAFNANTADEWLILMQTETEFRPTFRDLFRQVFDVNDQHVLGGHRLSAFSYKVLLEGLQGLASDCRDGGDAFGAPSRTDVGRALARAYENINNSIHLRSADQLEVLLRWHAICLNAIVSSSDLCVTLCSSLNVQQNLWKRSSASFGINLTHWATTVDARRVLTHAVAIQEIVEQLPRGRAHAIHMPSSLFSAAIAYAVFVLAGNPSVRIPATMCWQDVAVVSHIDSAAAPSSLSAVASSETQLFLRGELVPSNMAVSRNLLYELNSMSKLFRCLCSQWGIAFEMAEVVDQLIALCH